jgi:hypothetical protein
VKKLGFALTFGLCVLHNIGTAGATIIPSKSALDSFYTPDDGYFHAIVAQTSGSVHELYWAGNQPTSHSDDVLDTFSAGTVVAIAGYYTAFDENRHAIVGLSNGQVWEIYYNPSWGLSSDLLFTSNEGAINALAGFVSSDDVEHVVWTTTSGFVGDFRFGPYWTGSHGPDSTQTLGYLGAGNIADVAAYQNYDGYYHALVSTYNTPYDGIQEIFYTYSNVYTDVLYAQTTSHGASSIAAAETPNFPSGYNSSIVGYGFSGALNFEEYGPDALMGRSNDVISDALTLTGTSSVGIITKPGVTGRWGVVSDYYDDIYFFAQPTSGSSVTLTYLTTL